MSIFSPSRAHKARLILRSEGTCAAHYLTLDKVGPQASTMFTTKAFVDTPHRHTHGKATLSDASRVIYMFTYGTCIRPPCSHNYSGSASIGRYEVGVSKVAHEGGHLQSGLSQVWLTGTSTFDFCRQSPVSTKVSMNLEEVAWLTMVVECLRCGLRKDYPSSFAGLCTSGTRQRHWSPWVTTYDPGGDVA